MVIFFLVTGLRRKLQQKVDTARELINLQSKKPSPPDIKKKIYTAKYNNPKLDDYGAEPPVGFWETFPKASWEKDSVLEGGIDGPTLVKMAEGFDYPDSCLLGKVYKDLREGAKLGVVEEYRVSSTSTNAVSALDNGEEVTDALAGWIEDGFAIGPYSKEDMPFKEAKNLWVNVQDEA